MKKISLDELLKKYLDMPYARQYEHIIRLIEEGKIRQSIASGTNGKHPALYLKYYIVEEKKDYSALEDELKYTLNPAIDVDYYLRHPDNYEEDRGMVRKLDRYLREEKDRLAYSESVNERSFEIWGQEKFLSCGKGRKILKRCGLNIGDINVYATSEPFAYYSGNRNIPQNMLIIENKDTFYSMRQFLMNGGTEIFGEKISTLIYGAGKRCIPSFGDFDITAEPYMKDRRNNFFYFGDLDFEGIIIYEKVSKQFEGTWSVTPFVPAYEKMIEKIRNSSGIDDLPHTKEQQNRNIDEAFFSYFPENDVKIMKNILDSDRYIPQEIINIMDLTRHNTKLEME